MKEVLLKLNEVAERLSITEATARHLVSEKHLASVKVGVKRGGIRVSESEVERYVRAGARPGAMVREVLTLKESADLLEVSCDTILDLLRAKTLPAVQISKDVGSIRISREAIDEYLRGNTWSWSRGAWVRNAQVLAWNKVGGA